MSWRRQNTETCKITNIVIIVGSIVVYAFRGFYTYICECLIAMKCYHNDNDNDISLWVNMNC